MPSGDTAGGEFLSHVLVPVANEADARKTAEALAPYEPEHILVPTAGGPSSDLSAEIARLLREECGSQITLLHVSEHAEKGAGFLKEWAADHRLTDANLRVETGDVDTSIARSAADCLMVVIGATGRGLLSRLVRGSSVIDVVDEVDCSVVLAERPSGRSLRQRLFGGR